MAATKAVKEVRKRGTWDYAAGDPQRERITLYVSPMISAKPTQRTIQFDFAFYTGDALQVARRRYGLDYRIIAIFGVGNGPDPIDLIPRGADGRPDTPMRREIQRAVRAAMKEAILEKLRVPESRIQYLDTVINDVTTIPKGA